jgi:hypothetical protein
MKIEAEKIHYLPCGRLDSKNAAAYLGLSAKTLAMMRCYGKGPRFIKKGRIFYYEADLENWLNDHGRLSSTAQAMNFQGSSSRAV